MRRFIAAIIKFSFFLLAYASYSDGALAQCNSGNISGSNFVMTGAYDPFSPSDSYIAHTVTVVNTSTTVSCNYGIVFHRPSLPARMGVAPNRITYTISTSAGGSNIITTTAASVVASAWLPVLNVPRNRSVTATFYVNVPRGQIVSPGTYSDPINLWLYRLNSVGNLILSRLHTDNMIVRRTVATLISVNIAGGGTATVLDYGILSANAVRSVAIESRSNVNYNLSILSQNAGTLRLAPPYSSWSIPYTATFGGTNLNLTGTTLLGTFGATSYTGVSRTLSATIGPFTLKRSGLYTDEIIVTIGVAP